MRERVSDTLLMYKWRWICFSFFLVLFSWAVAAVCLCSDEWISEQQKRENLSELLAPGENNILLNEMSERESEWVNTEKNANYDWKCSRVLNPLET